MSDRVHLENLFRQILEAAPNAMVMTDMTGRIEMVNAQMEKMFGYKRNEMLGQPIESLIAERFRGHHAGLRAAFCADPRPGPMNSGRELYARREDGGEFQVEISLNPIETAAGSMVLSTIVDISHRKAAADRIQAALKEKEVLLAEIHHRVKNNLQIIYSLLNLQSARITDPAALRLLRDSENRVRSIALIHQTLYGSNDFARVDFALFLDTLLPVLSESYGVDPGRIAVRVEVEPVRLPINAAVPCGLVVNELITNAFKHAFPNDRAGEIRVALTRQSGHEVLLTVSDNGIGLAGDVDIEKTGTLGLRLVGLLANQLNGGITIHRADPMRISLRFPI